MSIRITHKCPRCGEGLAQFEVVLLSAPVRRRHEMTRTPFIVQAVSCHDELVAALLMLRDHADLFQAFQDDVGQAVLDSVNAILAKAKAMEVKE